MRVLIMHTDDPKVQKSVQMLQNSLRGDNISVETVSAQDAESTPISAASYDFICVVSNFTGWWKPQLPAQIDKLLKRALRLEGKRGAAFVESRLLGSAKALRLLMSYMERQGIIVEDFDTLSGGSEIIPIAKRLKSLA